MLDHMLFNKLKWWNIGDNAEKISINRQKYFAIPSKIEIHNNTSFENIDSGIVRYSLGEQTVSPIGRTVDDRYIFASDNFEYSVGRPDIGVKANGWALVKCADVTPIWGGKSLLSHVYQALRRVVIA